MSHSYELVGVDMSECVAYGEDVASFGQLFKTTLGMNSVLAAIVLYFLAWYAPRLAIILIDIWERKKAA
jgi:hypothetical protein